MKITLISLLIVLLLSACGTAATPAPTVDVNAIQTQAVQTALASQPTEAPEPTATKTPAATNTKAPNVDEIRQQLLDAVASDLAGLEDVESVSVVRYNQGTLEIELKTRWASQDRQADVSWSILQLFAPVFADFDKENLETIAGGPFAISLTTYATDGDYKYQSLTNWDTMQKIAKKSISHDEWVTAANAGFK